MSAVAIINYDAGNTTSVLNALQRLGVNAILTDRPGEIQSADKVIFPGVGNASAAMQSLNEKKLISVIKELTQPVLGICLGMQLLCDHSEENDTEGLGIINLKVKRMESPDKQFKIPQVGWNTIYDLEGNLFDGIEQNSFVYFVHSYFVENGAETIATTNYIQPFSAAIRKDNFYGVQFHAEKSAETGEKIISNFLSLR
jgi:glutamine amidotransferase